MTVNYLSYERVPPRQMVSSDLPHANNAVDTKATAQRRICGVLGRDWRNYIEGLGSRGDQRICCEDRVLIGVGRLDTTDLAIASAVAVLFTAVHLGSASGPETMLVLCAPCLTFPSALLATKVGKHRQR